MQFKVKSEALYNILLNGVDRERFKKRYFSGLKTFENMPYVNISLYDEKTRKQLGAIWGDWGVAAKLLYTDSEWIYNYLIHHKDLEDCWVEECTIGKDKHQAYRYITLSGFTKDHIINTDFITRYRDILQELINKEYGEYIPVKWYKKENMYD